MIPWSEVGYHDEYRALCAIVGRGKVASPDKWGGWQRLQDKYGWKMLLRAAERVEPINRWETQIEQVCIALAKEAVDAEVEARNRERIAALPKPTDHAARAALFASIMARHGLGSDNTTQETQR